MYYLSPTKIPFLSNSRAAKSMRAPLGWLLIALTVSQYIWVIAGSAHADWRDDITRLRIGIITHGQRNLAEAKLENFRLHMSNQLVVDVDITAFTNQLTLIHSLRTNQIHYAVLSATGYAVASMQCKCVEPVAIPYTSEGAAGFRTVLLSRSDSEVFEVADLKEHDFLLTGPGSTSGDLVPRWALQEAGLALEVPAGKKRYSPTPQDALKALITGKTDAIFSWTPATGDGTVRLGGNNIISDLAGVFGGGQTLRAIWQSPIIPNKAHVVLSNLPQELKIEIRSTLESMHSDAPFVLEVVEPSFAGFRSAADADFDPLFKILDDLSESRKGTN